jgi:transcriptional regulator with GAF, ATPase, and Fis domain
MTWTPGAGRLRFSISVFLIYFFFALLLWYFSLLAGQSIDRRTASYVLLFTGIVFSLSAALFAWSVESKRNFLEQEVKKKTQDLFQKNFENKKQEIAAATIYQSCRILFSNIPFDQVLYSAMELISKFLYVDEGSLMLVDSNKRLYIAASRGISQEVASQVHIGIGERVAGRAASMRREFLLVDGLNKYPEFEGIEPNPRISSSIVCPLICQNELLGVLNLNRTVTQENFTVADMINVSIFAAHVAQALKTAALHDSLQQRTAELQSIRQHLTDVKVRDLHGFKL